MLDELNIVLRYDYLPLAEVLAVLQARPADEHVVVTGRNAAQALIDAGRPRHGDDAGQASVPRRREGAERHRVLKNAGDQKMIITRLQHIVLVLLALLLGGSRPRRRPCRTPVARPDALWIAQRACAATPTTIRTFKTMLPQAKAVLIVPSLFKAGFIVGGEGGCGVLLTRGHA